MSRKIDILFLWGNYDIMDVARNDILNSTFGIDVAGKHDSCQIIWHGCCKQARSIPFNGIAGMARKLQVPPLCDRLGTSP